jgi:hypothetical protein
MLLLANRLQGLHGTQYLAKSMMLLQRANCGWLRGEMRATDLVSTPQPPPPAAPPRPGHHLVQPAAVAQAAGVAPLRVQHRTRLARKRRAAEVVPRTAEAAGWVPGHTVAEEPRKADRTAAEEVRHTAEEVRHTAEEVVRHIAEAHRSPAAAAGDLDRTWLLAQW